MLINYALELSKTGKYIELSLPFAFVYLNVVTMSYILRISFAHSTFSTEDMSRNPFKVARVEVPVDLRPVRATRQ